MKLTFLGTGTSTGVPQMRCNCAVCTSADPRDKRLRCSAMIEPSPGAPRILIDCGPDFREQMLRHGCPPLAALLITHSHYDHVGGIDDLRPYCVDFENHHFPVYCKADVADDLRSRVPYCFATHLYPGVPTYRITEVADRPFDVPVAGIGNVEVIPLPVIHGRLPILGYRIGKLAYITDCSQMPPAETLRRLSGVDTLIINALRPEPHPSHLSISEALGVIEAVAPRRAYLTHASHDAGLHAETALRLPPGVEYAFDDLTIDIP